MSVEPTSTRPFPWKCGRCERRAMRAAVVDYPLRFEHDGRAHEISVPQLHVARCEDCGEIVLDDEANERISASIRAHLGLLTPKQIRQNREQLRLSREQLADALGIAEPTLSRLESGGQIQQRVLDRLLRLYFGYEQVRTALADEQQLVSLATTDAR